MKNKKMAVAGISLLGSIGVISTGFAGWIISAQPQKGLGEGTIKADASVTSKSISITEQKFGTDAATNANINFAPVESTTAHNWLSIDTSKGSEDLDAVYTVKLSLSGVTTIKVSDVQLKEKDGGTVYSTLASGEKAPVGSMPAFTTNSAPTTNKGEGYILVKNKDTAHQFGTVAADKSVSAVLDSGTETMEFTVAVHFKWGAAFGNQNPYAYYNASAYTKQLQDDATAKIGALNVLSAGVGFDLTFTVSAE